LIVVDASLLTDFLLGETSALEAIEVARPGHEPLHAPELIEPEILNALRGLVRGGRVSEQRAAQAVGDLGRVRLACYPHAPLRARVWELRAGLSAYDATYLALAEALGDAMLLTADQALAAAGRHALGPLRVRCTA
jgi:predicted nucleic acid-binding protein